MVERHFHDIFFNGKSLADFGVHCSGDGVFNSPEKDYETVEVPGRNGDLHIFNERFKNIDVTYKAFIVGDDYPTNYGKDMYDDARSAKGIDFRARMRSMRAWLLYPTTYCRLEDTYHPDEFRLALFKGPVETEAKFLQAGEFDLTFNCKPQRFLKIGEFNTTYTDASFTIFNPTLFDAAPLLRVKGSTWSEDGYVTVNDVTIKILKGYEIYDEKGEKIPEPTIGIDSEIQDAYWYGQNCNKFITLENGKFFTLKPGENTISFSGAVTSVEITPRWWTI